MHEEVRPFWAILLVVLVALWGLALIVLTAFLIAMSLTGQPFSSSARIARSNDQNLWMALGEVT